MRTLSQAHVRPEAVPGCQREHFADPLGCSSPNTHFPLGFSAPAALPAACKTRDPREWEWARTPAEGTEAQRGKRGQRAGLPAGVGVGTASGGLWLDCVGGQASRGLTPSPGRGPWESAARVPTPPHCQALTAPLCSPGRGHIFFPLKNNIKNASFNLPIFLTVLFMKCSFENAILMPSS